MGVILNMIMLIIYLIYSLTIGYLVEKNQLVLREFFRKTRRVLKTPIVILNLAYGVVINGIFGILTSNATTFFGYIILTLVGLVAIINTAEKT